MRNLTNHSNLLFVLNLFFLSAPALAEFDKDDMKEIYAKIKSGEEILEVNSYPAEKVQIVRVTVGNFMEYVLDLNAGSCFVRPLQGTSLTRVPCGQLAKGYPLLGPIIRGAAFQKSNLESKRGHKNAVTPSDGTTENSVQGTADAD